MSPLATLSCDDNITAMLHERLKSQLVHANNTENAIVAQHWPYERDPQVTHRFPSRRTSNVKIYLHHDVMMIYICHGPGEFGHIF